MKKQAKNTSKSTSTMDRTPSASAGSKDSAKKSAPNKSEEHKTQKATTSTSSKNKR